LESHSGDTHSFSMDKVWERRSSGTGRGGKKGYTEVILGKRSGKDAFVAAPNLMSKICKGGEKVEKVKCRRVPTTTIGE